MGDLELSFIELGQRRSEITIKEPESIISY